MDRAIFLYHLLNILLLLKNSIYEGQSKITESRFISRRLTYTRELWHIHAMNCPASIYAIFKTMQSIDCCCLATEECEITSCVHA